MSVVTGLAAANGVHSRLTGTDEVSKDATYRAKSKGSTFEVEAIKADPTLTRIIERVASVTNQSDPAQIQGFQPEAAPGSGRYSQFVDAVQALRMDKSEASELTRERVAELKAAAAEVFNMRSDIPKDDSPVEVYAEQVQRKSAQDPDALEAREQATDRATELSRSEALESDEVVPSMGASQTDPDPTASMPSVAFEPASAKAIPETPAPAIGTTPATSEPAESRDTPPGVEAESASIATARPATVSEAD